MELEVIASLPGIQNGLISKSCAASLVLFFRQDSDSHYLMTGEVGRGQAGRRNSIGFLSFFLVAGLKVVVFGGSFNKAAGQGLGKIFFLFLFPLLAVDPSLFLILAFIFPKLSVLFCSFVARILTWLLLLSSWWLSPRWDSRRGQLHRLGAVITLDQHSAFPGALPRLGTIQPA